MSGEPAFTAVGLLVYVADEDRLHAAGEQPPIVADQYDAMLEAMAEAGAVFLAGMPEYAESVGEYFEYLEEVGETSAADALEEAFREGLKRVRRLKP